MTRYHDALIIESIVDHDGTEYGACWLEDLSEGCRYSVKKNEGNGWITIGSFISESGEIETLKKHIYNYL